MTEDLWPAPTAPGPVRATVSLPGSKSATNRALLLAALADAPSRLSAPLRARDTLLMAGALSSLGVEVREDGPDWVVTPAPLCGPAEVDCGLAGTVMRFVPPAAALASGPVRVDGDPRARERPMGALIAALRDLGVDVDDGGRGALPFTLAGRGAVEGGPVTVDASRSSQVVSGLLLAGARYRAGIEVRHVGPPVPSAPHLAMTVQMLRERGVEVDDGEPDVWQVAPGTIRAVDCVVEPDLSNAAPFLAAALATGGRVTVAGWPRTTVQAGDALRGLLTRLGGRCTLDDRGLTVEGGDTVHAADLDLHDVGELTPVLLSLCVLADGPSRLRGIAHLRGHETDRLAALAREVTALGGDVAETPDGLAVQPRPLHGGTFHTYGDHRMAHAGAVLGLVVPGIEVEDIATTGKTMPDFPGLWRAMIAGGVPA